MTKTYRILVDGVDTGYTVTATNKNQALAATDAYWMDYIGKFRQYGEVGAVTVEVA